MDSIDIKYAKDWRLRKWLTEKRKALVGCRAYPSGLSRLMNDSLERDIRLIRSELQKRGESK